MTTMLVAREQTRASYRDQEGYVERDGVRVFWERYGEGEPTFLLPPTWEIVHSRATAAGARARTWRTPAAPHDHPGLALPIYAPDLNPIDGLLIPVARQPVGHTNLNPMLNPL